MRALLAIFVAAAIAAPVEASAQVWKPPEKAKKKKAPAPRKKKPKPRPSPPEPEPEPEPEPVNPEDEPEDLTTSDEEPEAEAEETEEEEDTSEDGDTVRIEDDLDDVGADVTFSESDLETDAAGGANRLETKALGFGRMGVDTIHDPPPRVATGRAGTGEDVIAFRAHGRAESTSRFREKLKVKVAGRADAELGLDGDTNLGIERYEAEIWDTYADVYLRGLDLRFGNQIIAWGTADLLSPNDVVNPRDLRRGIAIEPDELRRPVLALAARAYTGPLSLQGIWIPVAPANRFDLLDGDYAILGPHAATDVERRVGALVSALAADPMLGPSVSPILAIGSDPDNGIDTGELGAHASVETRRFDVHGYFLWGQERNPRIRLDEELRDFLISTPEDMVTPEVFAERIALIAEAGRPAVRVDYPRRVHAGVATATRIEPFGIKLDAAYTPKTSTILVAPGAGPVLGTVERLPQLTGTVSIDYDRGTEMSLVVEASHLRVLDVPADGQVFQMTRGDHLTIVGTRFSWNPRSGPVTVSLLGFTDIDAPSYAVRPALELSGHDHWSVEIAGTVYGHTDPENPGVFGVFDDADEVTLTVQYGL